MSRVERAEKRDEEAKALQGAEGAEDGRGSPEVGPSGVEGAFWQSYFADLFVEHDEDSNGALDMQEFLKVMEVIAPPWRRRSSRRRSWPPTSTMAGRSTSTSSWRTRRASPSLPTTTAGRRRWRAAPLGGARRQGVRRGAARHVARGEARRGCSSSSATRTATACSTEEFANVMRRLCPGIDDANIAAAFVALDTDESGTIELDEFVRGQPVLEEEKKKWRQKKKPRRKKSLSRRRTASWRAGASSPPSEGIL